MFLTLIVCSLRAAVENENLKMIVNVGNKVFESGGSFIWLDKPLNALVLCANGWHFVLHSSEAVNMHVRHFEVKERKEIKSLPFSKLQSIIFAGKYNLYPSLQFEGIGTSFLFLVVTLSRRSLKNYCAMCLKASVL